MQSKLGVGSGNSNSRRTVRKHEGYADIYVGHTPADLANAFVALAEVRTMVSEPFFTFFASLAPESVQRHLRRSVPADLANANAALAEVRKKSLHCLPGCCALCRLEFSHRWRKESFPRTLDAQSYSLFWNLIEFLTANLQILANFVCVMMQ